MARSAKKRTPQRVTSPKRKEDGAKTYTSTPVSIEFAKSQHRYVRADLEIQGIFHGEGSYEGMVFLNNPRAKSDTAKTLKNGYAGSFYVFGHGGCLGDPGHCEINEAKRDDFDFRMPHPLTPANKRITVTDTLREIAKYENTVTVTIVPVVTAANELCDAVNVFRCEKMQFIAYNG
jgi:tyrosinase